MVPREWTFSCMSDDFTDICIFKFTASFEAPIGTRANKSDCFNTFVFYWSECASTFIVTIPYVIHKWIRIFVFEATVFARTSTSPRTRHFATSNLQKITTLCSAMKSTKTELFASRQELIKLYEFQSRTQ